MLCWGEAFSLGYIFPPKITQPENFSSLSSAVSIGFKRIPTFFQKKLLCWEFLQEFRVFSRRNDKLSRNAWTTHNWISSTSRRRWTVSEKATRETPTTPTKRENVCTQIGKFMISQRGRSGWVGEESYDNFLKRVQHFSALLVGCFDSVHTVSSI